MGSALYIILHESQSKRYRHASLIKPHTSNVGTVKYTPSDLLSNSNTIVSRCGARSVASRTSLSSNSLLLRRTLFSDCTFGPSVEGL